MSIEIQPEDGGTYEYIVNGAFMLCDKGVCPTRLKATPKILSFDGKDVCTTIDNNPVVNNFNFGLCSITQKPCKNCISLLKWVDYKKDFSVEDGELLLDRSSINCVLGGKITFIMSGQ